MINRLQFALCMMIFVSAITVSIQQSHARDIFSTLAPPAKHDKPLSESTTVDSYMKMWISGPVTRALRLHQALIPRFEKMTMHNELTQNGIKSVLKNIEDMGIKGDLMDNKVLLEPEIGKDIKLTERRVIDGVLTWTFEVPVEINFRDPSLRSQPFNKKPYVFLVRAVRSNEAQHKRHMALDHIEMIK